MLVTLSPKRINKGDSSKLVIEESYFTEWIDLQNSSKLQKEFIDSLNVKHHPFTDLYAFYNSYLDKIFAFNASKHSGQLKTNQETKIVLEQISFCEAKIIECKNKIKKETNFNNQVNLNIELKKMNEKLKELKERL
jgi:hypothetical protein